MAQNDRRAGFYRILVKPQPRRVDQKLTSQSSSKGVLVVETIFSDPFGARATLHTAEGSASIYRLDALEKRAVGAVGRLPFSLKILLESLLRNVDGHLVTEEDVRTLAGWNAASPASREVPFRPGTCHPSGFYGSPRRSRSGRHALRHAAFRRRSRKNQPAGARGSGH